MTSMKVPFVDLGAGVAAHREAYLAAMARVLDAGVFSGGPEVDGFEAEFAAFAGSRHAIAVADGTHALLLALRALGVTPGDEVITAPNSFFATAEAISLAGATPVFADVRDDTLLIDVESVAARLSPRTRCVIPVHLFGQIADMGAIGALAAAHGLKVLEDAAQAHGARRAGGVAGSMGHAGSFSFYPTKNLGAFGEGGAVTTSDDEVAEVVRALRDHGQRGKHNHELIGYNARLDALKCACLRVRLSYMTAVNEARQRLARAYQEGLRGVAGVRLVGDDPAGEAVYHLFVVRVAAAARDGVRAALDRAGVSTAIHYPAPIHRQRAYAHLGHGPGHCPVAEQAAAEMISLPMYPEMSLEAAAHVVSALVAAVTELGR